MKFVAGVEKVCYLSLSLENWKKNKQKEKMNLELFLK